MWTPYCWALHFLLRKVRWERGWGWWNKKGRIRKSALFVPNYWWSVTESFTITVEQCKHHVAHVIRQLHLGYGAGHLLHGSWERERESNEKPNATGGRGTWRKGEEVKKKDEKNEIAQKKTSQVPARMIDYQASKGRGRRKHRGLWKRKVVRRKNKIKQFHCK